MNEKKKDTYFDKLEIWKEYPNFKAEKRVDWILAQAIPILLEEKFESECKLILPEFPLRNGTLNDNNSNRSRKVDYYCLLDNGEHYLIELKTDSGSINSNQINCYKKVREKTVYEILQGLIIISENTKKKYRDKYELYISELVEHIGSNKHSITSERNKKFNIIFIVPNKSNEKLKEFDVFELKDLCNILKKSDDEFLRKSGAIVENW